PRIGAQETERQFQDERLARAAGPEEDAHRAPGHGEAQLLHHDEIVEGERDLLERDGDLRLPVRHHAGAASPREGRDTTAKSCQICCRILGSMTRTSPLSGALSENSVSVTVPHCGPIAAGSNT